MDETLPDQTAVKISTAASRSLRAIGKAFEQLLSEQAGVPVKHARATEFETTKKSNPDRHYSQHLFRIQGDGLMARRLKLSGNGKTIVLFAKRGPEGIVNPFLEAYLSRSNNPGFNVPKFVGQIQLGGVTAAAWTFAQGVSPPLDEYTPLEMKRLVRAIAAVNALGEEATRNAPNLKINTPWVQPVVHRLRRDYRNLFNKSRTDLRVVAKQIDLLAEVEPKVLARFQTFENRFLTHHDLKRENVILARPKSGITIIDWVSASVSVAGSGLRFLANLDPNLRARMAAYYVACMRQHGTSLNVDDIVFVIVAQQAFWALETGYRRRSRSRIRRGLELVPLVYDCLRPAR